MSRLRLRRARRASVGMARHVQRLPRMAHRGPHCTACWATVPAPLTMPVRGSISPSASSTTALRATVWRLATTKRPLADAPRPLAEAATPEEALIRSCMVVLEEASAGPCAAAGGWSSRRVDRSAKAQAGALCGWDSAHWQAKESSYRPEQGQAARTGLRRTVRRSSGHRSSRATADCRLPTRVQATTSPSMLLNPLSPHSLPLLASKATPRLVPTGKRSLQAARGRPLIGGAAAGSSP